MPITVTRIDGSPHVLSIRTALRQIPDDVDLVPILYELGVGNSVTVTLRDGTAANLVMNASDAQPELEEPEPSAQLPVQTSPPREIMPGLLTYNAHCKVLLELDVSVQCMARSERHAEQIIQDVFRGERSPPAGFRPVFEREEVEAFMRRLKTVLETGDVAQAGAQEVLVTGFVDPLRLLEYQP